MCNVSPAAIIFHFEDLDPNLVNNEPWSVCLIKCFWILVRGTTLYHQVSQGKLTGEAQSAILALQWLNILIWGILRNSLSHLGHRSTVRSLGDYGSILTIRDYDSRYLNAVASQSITRYLLSVILIMMHVDSKQACHYCASLLCHWGVKLSWSSPPCPRS